MQRQKSSRRVVPKAARGFCMALTTRRETQLNRKIVNDMKTKPTVTEIIGEGLDACIDPKRGWSKKHQRASDLANAAPDLLRVLKTMHRHYGRLHDFASEEIAESVAPHMHRRLVKLLLACHDADHETTELLKRLVPNYRAPRL